MSLMGTMMEDMYPEDMMEMMSAMMPLMMEKMGQVDPITMIEAIHEMIPRMMANCLDRMEIHDREKMFTFCTNMLMDMKQRFHG